MWIPIWLLTRWLVPFLPEGHPWHEKRFTLQDWEKHGTPLAKLLSVLLGISTAMFFGGLIALLWRLVWR